MLTVVVGAVRGQQVGLLDGGIPVDASDGVRVGCRDVLFRSCSGSPAVRVNWMKPSGPAVEHPFEVSGDADRHAGESGTARSVPDLVHQFKGGRPGRSAFLSTVMIGIRAVLAHLEQLQRLRLEAFGGVDEHHRGVDGDQHPIGVFGEVGVAGVSRRLMTAVRYGNCNTVEVIEMPLAFSMSIQSDTVARRPALPWTAPAR